MYCLQNRWKPENKLLLNKEAPKIYLLTKYPQITILKIKEHKRILCKDLKRREQDCTFR